jgi:predicted ester cyclase
VTGEVSALNSLVALPHFFPPCAGAVVRRDLLAKLLHMKAEEENKALVRAAFEQVWNLRNVDRIPDFYSPEFVAEYPQFGPPRQRQEGLRGWVEGLWSANPDYHEELCELIAEGAFVVARLMISGIRRVRWGELPSAKRIESEEIAILKIQEGKIVGQHGVVDVLPVLRELGVISLRS